MEDELLETSNNDDEPETKRRNQSQTSDVDENEEVNSIHFFFLYQISLIEQIDEVGDEEDRLLADQETKHTNLSTDSHDESNHQYEFESNDLDDEVQLLDS